MINILILRSTFDPGGTENLILRLFNYEQHLVKFNLCFLRPGSLENYLYSHTNSHFKLYRKHSLDVKVILNIITLIRKTNSKYIHTHQLLELFYAVLVRIFLPRIGIIHQIHGHDSKKYVPNFIERLICILFVSRIIVVSNSLGQQLSNLNFPAAKMVVLHNAVLVNENVDETQKWSFFKQIAYNSDDFLIGMIGNFVPEKDHFTLCRAYRKIMHDHSNYKLILIGRESLYAERCKELFSPIELRERVFFLGQVYNASDLLPFFNLFIFSSLYETFGISVVEAILHKVPVICSDIPALRELSENETIFSLFKKSDVYDLVSKIDEITKNPPKIEELNMRSEYFKMKYDYGAYVHALANIYGVVSS